MLTVNKINQIEQLIDLQSQWLNLLNQSATNQIFLSPNFLLNWWKAYGHGQLNCYAFFLEQQLIGLAPLFVCSDEKKLKLLLKLLVKAIGYAAIKISKILESKGGKLLIQPEGFFVDDTKGPITKGEEEKAVKWGEEIKSKYLDLGNE